MKPVVITAALMSLAAPAAFAKGHDQSNTEVPGANVVAETVGPAQTLGRGLDNRPEDKGPKADKPGKSRGGR